MLLNSLKNENGLQWSARQINLSVKEKNQNSQNLCVKVNESGYMDNLNLELEHLAALDDFTGEKIIKGRKRRHSGPSKEIFFLMTHYFTNTIGISSGIIFRETSVHFDDENGQQIANIRGWTVVRDSMHFVKVLN